MKKNDVTNEKKLKKEKNEKELEETLKDEND